MLVAVNAPRPNKKTDDPILVFGECQQLGEWRLSTFGEGHDPNVTSESEVAILEQVYGYNIHATFPTALRVHPPVRAAIGDEFGGAGWLQWDVFHRCGPDFPPSWDDGGAGATNHIIYTHAEAGAVVIERSYGPKATKDIGYPKPAKAHRLSNICLALMKAHARRIGINLRLNDFFVQEVVNDEAVDVIRHLFRNIGPEMRRLAMTGPGYMMSLTEPFDDQLDRAGAAAILGSPTGTAALYLAKDGAGQFYDGKGNEEGKPVTKVIDSVVLMNDGDYVPDHMLDETKIDKWTERHCPTVRVVYKDQDQTGQ